MKLIKRLFIIFIVIGIITVAVGYYLIFTPNVEIQDKDYVYLYIPSNATFNDVLDSLENKHIIKNWNSLLFVMKLKKYDKLIKSGRYKIKNHWSNNTLVNVLRAGLQEPVKFTFNNIRTKEQMAKRAATVLEPDSVDFITAFSNDTLLKKYGFNSQNILAMFIPNTYEFYWNTTPKKFLERMKKEYDKFWTSERLEKAKKIGLSPLEVIILASIVQAEQMQHPDERPRIAGLYLNRLKKGIPLQADPTLIYALGDFSIKRVYDWMKNIDSPFNTYKHTGLPPAPIITPDVSSIDAVLNAENHGYLYMCAKDDFSGYHYFSKTLKQHLIYAKRYQQALNKLGIK